MTYGWETQTLKRGNDERAESTELSVIGITESNRISDRWIQEKTDLKGIAKAIVETK